MCNVAHVQIEFGHFETVYDLFSLILINKILIIITHSGGDISENGGVGPISPQKTPKTPYQKQLYQNFIKQSKLITTKQTLQLEGD